MNNNRKRLVVEIDEALKEELREYGQRPDVDRSMGWLVGHFVKEGLARAKEGASNK